MKLTVLGCGTPLSGAEKATSGYLIDDGKVSLVFDLGFGSFKNLQRIAQAKNINHVFFSHMHLDHIGDFPSFLYHRNGLVYMKTSQPSPVSVFGPEGIRKYYDFCKQNIDHLADLYPVAIEELESSKKRIGNYTITTNNLKHYEKPCLGYRIESEGKTIVYSGDTGYCEELIELAYNADLLVIECTFSKEKKDGGHMNSTDCGLIAQKAGAKKVLLTHIGEDAAQKDVVREVKEHFSGKILVAHDLLEVNL
jgi:ribonuclease BN (tRNA processing enzyme)